MSDVSHLKPLIDTGPYSLILMDPPWPNLSVKRSKEYSFMSDMYDLFKIPLKRLVSPGTLVAVWITNHPKVYDFVKRRLFPDWGLELEGEWTWIKVTRKGELVLPLTQTKYARAR